MQVYDIVYDAEQALEQHLQEHGTLVSAKAVRLDVRAGSVWVTEDAIVCKGNAGSLEYYGGFEYVDSDYKTRLGEYTIYFADDERVASCLEYYEETQEAA